MNWILQGNWAGLQEKNIFLYVTTVSTIWEPDQSSIDDYNHSRKRILAPVVLQLTQKSPGGFHVGRALLRGMQHPPLPPEYWRCLLQDVICITCLDTIKGWLPTFGYHGPNLKQNSSSFVSEIHTLQTKYWADQRFVWVFFFYVLMEKPK